MRIPARVRWAHPTCSTTQVVLSTNVRMTGQPRRPASGWEHACFRLGACSPADEPEARSALTPPIDGRCARPRGPDDRSEALLITVGGGQVEPFLGADPRDDRGRPRRGRRRAGSPHWRRRQRRIRRLGRLRAHVAPGTRRNASSDRDSGASAPSGVSRRRRLTPPRCMAGS